MNRHVYLSRRDETGTTRFLVIFQEILPLSLFLLYHGFYFITETD